MADDEKMKVGRIFTTCPAPECPYRTVAGVRGAGLNVMVELRGRVEQGGPDDEGAWPSLRGRPVRSQGQDLVWTAEAHVRSPRGRKLLELRVGDALSLGDVVALAELPSYEDLRDEDGWLPPKDAA